MSFFRAEANSKFTKLVAVAIGFTSGRLLTDCAVSLAAKNQYTLCDNLIGTDLTLNEQITRPSRTFNTSQVCLENFGAFD